MTIAILIRKNLIRIGYSSEVKFIIVMVGIMTV